MKARGLAMTIAVLLALGATSAIFLYVQGVKNEAKPSTGEVSVIVSKKDIVSGTRMDTLIQEGSLTALLVPKDAVVQGAVTSLAQVQGQTATAFILQGEQISTARLSGTTQHTGGKFGIPVGMVAVTIALEAPQAVGGGIQTRDHVSVLATFNNVSVNRAKSIQALLNGQTQHIPIGDITLTVVPDVLVLQVSGPGSVGGSGQTQLTLALDPKDAEKVIFANKQGTVWVALLPPGEKGLPQAPVNVGDLLRGEGPTPV